jgi:probable rRNA maturation factor
MIAFNIDPRYKDLITQKLLKSAAEVALTHEGVSTEADLSLAITGDTQLKKLNRQFRGESHATDVLSFPSEEHDIESGRRYLGDVIISLPHARAQAKAAGHPLQAELQLLAVHGILHLLGHDHATRAERQRMWTAQDEILSGLGLSIHSAQAEALHAKS